jgi:hypothetical protein
LLLARVCEPIDLQLRWRTLIIAVDEINSAVLSGEKENTKREEYTAHNEDDVSSTAD